LFRKYLQARTGFFDTAVLDAIADGVTQIVLLGAGYDDRALRMRTPGVRFIEVDHPATQADKRQRLQGLGIDSAGIVFIAVDLATGSLSDALAGVYDERASTLFVCEAMVPYLPFDRMAAVLDDLGGLADPSCRLVIDLPLQPTRLTGRMALGGLRLLTTATREPVLTVMTPEQAHALLREHGWAISWEVDIGELGARALSGATTFVVAQPG
jgi:methyltransferase (TIGR00027 family)